MIALGVPNMCRALLLVLAMVAIEVVAVGVASYWHPLSYVPRSWHSSTQTDEVRTLAIWIRDGRFVVSHRRFRCRCHDLKVCPTSSPTSRRAWNIAGLRVSEWCHNDSACANWRSFVSHSVHVPYWYIAVIVGAVPLYVFTTRLRRHCDSSSCKSCRYSLVGNVSGRCPECGTIVA